MAAENKLQSIPELPASGSALSQLFLDHNAFVGLGDGSVFSGLLQLSVLTVGANKLESIPAALATLPNLKLLDLTNNSLQDIPNQLGKSAVLNKLLMDGNPFRRIPRAKMTGGIAAFKQYLLSRLSEQELKEHEASLATMRAAASAKPTAGGGGGGGGMRFERKSAVPDADAFVPMKIGEVRPPQAAAPPPQAAAAPPKPTRAPTVHDAWAEAALRDAAANKKLVLKSAKPPLTAVPDQVSGFSDGVSIDLSENQLKELPPGDWFAGAAFESTLTTLILDSNQLAHFPLNSVVALSSLSTLSLKKNLISAVPPAISSLQSLTSLDLRNNRLNDFPSGVMELPALRVLLLGTNRIVSLPQQFGSCGLKQTLMEFDVGNNQLKTLWSNLQSFTALTSLNIENNALTQIPPELALLPLKALMVGGNPQRQLKWELVKQGTPAVMEYLRTRLPAELLVLAPKPGAGSAAAPPSNAAPIPSASAAAPPPPSNPNPTPMRFERRENVAPPPAAAADDFMAQPLRKPQAKPLAFDSGSAAPPPAAAEKNSKSKQKALEAAAFAAEQERLAQERAAGGVGAPVQPEPTAGALRKPKAQPLSFDAPAAAAPPPQQPLGEAIQKPDRKQRKQPRLQRSWNVNGLRMRPPLQTPVHTPIHLICRSESPLRLNRNRENKCNSNRLYRISRLPLPPLHRSNHRSAQLLQIRKPNRKLWRRLHSQRSSKKSGLLRGCLHPHQRQAHTLIHRICRSVRKHRHPPVAVEPHPKNRFRASKNSLNRLSPNPLRLRRRISMHRRRKTTDAHRSIRTRAVVVVVVVVRTSKSLLARNHPPVVEAVDRVVPVDWTHDHSSQQIVSFCRSELQI